MSEDKKLPGRKPQERGRVYEVIDKEERFFRFILGDSLDDVKNKLTELKKTNKEYKDLKIKITGAKK